MSKRKFASSSVKALQKKMGKNRISGEPIRKGELPRILIVGSGLTGSLTSFHLRQKCGDKVYIDVADMARGAGGRMSTTRWGSREEYRANTGAQYISCFSPDAIKLLETVCTPRGDSCDVMLERVETPLKRSTHFALQQDDRYVHYLPSSGTNSVVKQFLRFAVPDEMCFGARLQQLSVCKENGLVCPQFDRGGDRLSQYYDAVILAMPPKDIMKFFGSMKKGGSNRPDPQSQADLHRRTNRGVEKQTPQGCHKITLPASALQALQRPVYNGRYSLTQWFGEGNPFVKALWSSWTALDTPDEIIDMLCVQEGGVVVCQSTVTLWEQVSGGGKRREKRKRSHGSKIGGKGRNAARAHLVSAMERIAGCKMPRANHAKLLNWRTSQITDVEPGGHTGIVTAQRGRLIFTGDWCSESSFEGCNIAAKAAAGAAEIFVLSS